MLMARSTSEIDKLSNLPDTLLCHILSFLPTIDAVATSVLSKKWTPLWLSVTTLDFNENDARFDNSKEGAFSFHQIVYAVMLKRDVTAPVKKFCLRAGHQSRMFNSSDVSIWVNAAIQRRVEHLELHGTIGINLPFCILGSRTLVVLKLKSIKVNNIFSDGFPSLKILHLDFVIFERNHYLSRLLWGCPILEELNLFYMISTVGVYFKATCTFYNLTICKLIMMMYKWVWVVGVLKHCPKLQSFEIKMACSCINEDKKWKYPQFVPECFSSHLITCSMVDYGGGEGELQFAKYIMRNAKVLRNMRICSVGSASPEAKYEMLKELSMCSRSSMACELSFK